MKCNISAFKYKKNDLTFIIYFIEVCTFIILKVTINTQTQRNIIFQGKFGKSNPLENDLMIWDFNIDLATMCYYDKRLMPACKLMFKLTLYIYNNVQATVFNFKNECFNHG